MRQIIEPGSKVFLGDIEATVLEVNIKQYDETYKVVWWNGRTRTVEWVDSCELIHQERTPIGFVGQAAKTKRGK